MKRIFPIATVLILGLHSLFAADKVAASVAANGPEDSGVTINGVTWARANVASRGTFASNSLNNGNYYTSSEAKTACPEGWRLPTQAEFYSLIESGAKWMPDYKIYVQSGGEFMEISGTGYLIGSGTDAIFLPAAGYRDYDGHGMREVGSNGKYWSSTTHTRNNSHFYLDFYSNGANPHVYGGAGGGFSVRCVKVNATTATAHTHSTSATPAPVVSTASSAEPANDYGVAVKVNGGKVMSVVPPYGGLGVHSFFLNNPKTVTEKHYDENLVDAKADPRQYRNISVYKFDPDGEIREMKASYDYKFSYYDDSSVTIERHDPDRTPSYFQVFHYEYEYDESGGRYLDRMEQFDGKGNLEWTFKYYYDSQNRCYQIKITETRGAEYFFQKMHYNPKGSLEKIDNYWYGNSEPQSVDYFDPETGLISKTFNFEYTDRFTYKFDSHGNWIERTTYTDEPGKDKNEPIEAWVRTIEYW